MAGEFVSWFGFTLGAVIGSLAVIVFKQRRRVRQLEAAIREIEAHPSSGDIELRCRGALAGEWPPHPTKLVN